jgi:hypothetical protein
MLAADVHTTRLVRVSARLASHAVDLRRVLRQHHARCGFAKRFCRVFGTTLIYYTAHYRDT